MRRFRLILVVFFLLIPFFFSSASAQVLPEDWYEMADTAWVINSTTVLAIAVGESPDLITAKKIAALRAKALGIDLLGEKHSDTLVADSGEKITKIRTYSQVSSVVRKEKTLQKEDGTYLYYLAARVVVIITKD